MRFAALTILPCLLLSACAEEPFVDSTSKQLDTIGQASVHKQKQDIVRKGFGEVCFAANATADSIQQAANDACADYGLQAVMDHVVKYQCRITNPHLAIFRCVDPAMRDEKGSFINVFDPVAVGKWEKRTGRKAPLRQTAGAFMAWPERGDGQASSVTNSRPILNEMRDSVTLPPLRGPSPAEASVDSEQNAAPLAPAPISRPTNAPVVSPAPNPAPFSLPVDSWGDHF